MMKKILPLTFSAAFVLAGCNSSSVLESMEGINKPSLTTGSIRPKQEIELETEQQAVSSGQDTSQDLKLISAMTDEGSDLPAASQAEALISKPAVKPEKAPVQVASLRPQSVKSASRYPLKNTRIHRAKFSDAKPIDFGKASPKYFAVHGVDVSRWQYDIDWKKLRTRGANFAFIKATEGGDHIDPMFKTNWDGAAEAGIPRGAYHFMYWCRVAEQQADWFIRNVPKVKGALPPVIDVEWNNHSKTCPHRPSRAKVLEKMRVFMDKVEKHYGQKPIIYTAPDFYEDNLKGQFKGYTFWLRSVAEHPRGRYPNRKWHFWQYSGTGKSLGVDTHIDLNVFNGSEKSWRTWLARNLH